MGFMMVKSTLCMLLHHYNFTAIDQKIKFKPVAGNLADENKIHMKIKKRI